MSLCKNCRVYNEIGLSLFSVDLPIQSVQWTSDGYALAVQSPGKWALYSPFGDLMFCDCSDRTKLSNDGSQVEESRTELPPNVSGLVRFRAPSWLRSVAHISAVR